MPFIILGAIIAGVLEEFLPQKLITRILPKRRWISIFIGGLLGLIFPMCECGIIPVMRRLLRKGLPLSCCIAYLLAGPIINVIVMLSTYTAFSGSSTFVEAPPTEFARVAGMIGTGADGHGPGTLTALPQIVSTETDAPTSSTANSFQLGSVWMTIFRVGLGYVIAITTALIVDWQYEKHGSNLLKPLAVPQQEQADPDRDEQRRSIFQRLSTISETALHDFIDITVFLILGALLASTVKLWLTEDQIESFALSNPWIVILGMMALAIVLCLCSEADAFVAASFTTLSPSAKLAFLVLGPMMDFKLYFMYTRVFRRRLIWTIILSVIIQVFLYCLILHYIWQGFSPMWMAS